MFGRYQGGGGGSRPTCKFFLEGRCRFGDSCKNEHPRGQQSQTASSNRFAALSNVGGGGNQRGFSSGGGDKSRPNDTNSLPFQLDRNNIRNDLTTGGPDGEKPIWPLSAYGPGKQAPLELIDAEFEKSPEEMRVLYCIARASGNPQTVREYEQGEATLVDAANAKAQFILSNLDSAIEYILNGKDTDKDRNGQSKLNSNPSQSGFGHTLVSGSTNSGFGTQSAQHTRPSDFAAFGQPSKSGGNAFGQASSLGGIGAPVSTPAFGAPSMPGAQNTTPGMPVAARPAFGAPSAFGAAAQMQGSTFGSSSSLGSQASPFAAVAQNPSQQSSGISSASPFGSTNAQTNALGAAQRQQPTFGSTGFGQPSQPTDSAGGGFGQASQLGGGGFGQLSQAASVSGFGQPSNPGNSGGFGQAAQNNVSTGSPFAQAGNSNPLSAGSGFGAFPQPRTGNNFGSQPLEPGPSLNQSRLQVNGTGDSSNTTRNGSGKLLRWKGCAVRYDAEGIPSYQEPRSGKTERIWIEKGQPAPHPDFEGLPEAYQGERGRLLQQLYEVLGETNTFRDGVIPEIPPKREWIRWDV